MSLPFVHFPMSQLSFVSESRLQARPVDQAPREAGPPQGEDEPERGERMDRRNDGKRSTGEKVHNLPIVYFCSTCLNNFLVKKYSLDGRLIDLVSDSPNDLHTNCISIYLSV
jgi:hypothetical protein